MFAYLIWNILPLLTDTIAHDKALSHK